MKLRIHLDLTGPRGDDYDLFLDQGEMAIRRGIPRPPDSVVQVSTETFLGMLSGRVTPSTASMTGQVRVCGEPLAGLVVSGLVAAFRQATEGSGAPGQIARGLSRWFDGGASR